MLHLHTLGTVYVADGPAPLAGAASQRRLLAFLSVLAVSEPAGVAREKLVALLWPDVEPEKGHHSLTQALYQARRALRCEDLFSGSATLRLNAARITSDVREFGLAAGAGDFAAAVDHYRGEFLADFFISGNSEFDRWADGHRQRLRTQCASALEQLATAAAASGDLTKLVEHRQRIAALDPLDSRAARLLIESLWESGNPAGAHRHLKVHQALLREELDLPLPADLATLEENLSRPPAAPSRTPVSSVTVDRGPDFESPRAIAETSSTPKRGRFGRAGIGVALAVGAAAAIMWSFRGDAKSTAAPGIEGRVLVAPFRVTGADASLGFLRDGLVELMSLRLGVDSARQPDVGAVLQAWRSATADGGADFGTEDLARVARRFGARDVVTGSVVGNAAHMVINAQVVDLTDTTRRAGASVEGPLDSLSSLVDRLSGRMMIASAGQAERFRRAVTPSPEALRSYLNGLAEYRRGDNRLALRHFDAAIRRDTAFALGGMYLALTADRLNAAEQQGRGIYLAWSNRQQLAERDRLLLTAFAGPRFPQSSPASEQLAAWEAAVSWSPGRIDALLEYANRLIRSERLFGVGDRSARAISLLREVLRTEPDNLTAQNLMLSLAIRRGGHSLRQLDTLKDLPVWAVWSIAMGGGDSSALNRIRGRMTSLSDADLTSIARLGQFMGRGVDDVDRALRIRRLRATRRADELDAILAQHSLALLQGRPILALDLTEQLEEAQPASRAHLRLRLLDALYGEGDTTAAARAASVLAGFVDGAEPASPDARAIRLADACALGQWRLAMRDTIDMRRLIVTLRSAGVPRGAVPISANPHACAALLEAALAVAAKSADAEARLAAVDSLVLGGPGGGDAEAYAHILMARLYRSVGRPRQALAAIRRRPYFDGWPRYLATARREEGELALSTGDRDGGIAVYRKYLGFRGSPEPRLAGEVAGIRAAVRPSRP